MKHYTDKELAALLPTWPLERRIEEVIRKYVGGAMSTYYDGETNASEADAKIAAYLLRKLKPWLGEAVEGPSPEPKG